jgi:hypothetical protein
MFERLIKNLIADMAPKLIPQLLRSLADQIESGQISFGKEEITTMMETPEFRAVIESCEMPQ